MLPNLLPKGKIWLEIMALPVIIALIAIAAYGLGRLSALEGQKDQLKIHYPGEALPLNSEQAPTEVH